jgi:hypothetical protein
MSGRQDFRRECKLAKFKEWSEKCQGATSVVPKTDQKRMGFSLCGICFLSFTSRQRLKPKSRFGLNRHD